MAKQHFLVFVIRNYKANLSFEVRRHTSERLTNVLQDRNWQAPGFFLFDTVDGKTVVINLEQVQAVRYLWEPSVLPTDETRHEGEVLIYLRDSETPISTYTEIPDQLCDCLMALEDFPNGPSFPAFTDGDGEMLQINAREVVWAVAPTHLIEEGMAEPREDLSPEDG